jgi:hypothetical protein
VTERPILFSAPMVQAILDGRKTQTRRIIKPQPAVYTPRVIDITEPMYEPGEGGWGQVRTNWSSPSTRMPMGEPEREVWVPLRSPYGDDPGNLLWVRETWTSDVRNAGTAPGQIERTEPIWYRAGGDPLRATPMSIPSTRWRPAIHMPRWASRITLRVTEIRVERLHAITEADAEAEGAPAVLVPPDGGSAPHVEGFRELWDSINGAGAWEANPYVWVISFERVTP